MRVLFLTATVAATTLIWLAAGELPGPARVWTAVLMAPLPALFVLQAAALERMSQPLPRIQAYVSSALALWALAALTWFVAMDSGFEARTLGLVVPRAGALVAWTLGATAAGFAIQLFSVLRRAPESEVLRQLIPRTTTERAVFVLLSLTAGFAEELAFRGFLLAALHLATGSIVVSLVLSSAAFGVMHAYQHARGAARAAALGLLLAVPVLATGSVLPSMIAHAALDVIGGLWLARWLLRE